MTTLHFIIGLIRLMEGLGLGDYAKTLLGPRTRGTITNKGLLDLPADLQLEEYRPEVGANPLCRYFKADVSAYGMVGELGATTLDKLTEAQLPQLRVRKGAHGLEFYLDQDMYIPVQTTELNIITGPKNDKASISETNPEVVYTWYMGGVTPITKPDQITVKLHNGQ